LLNEIKLVGNMTKWVGVMRLKSAELRCKHLLWILGVPRLYFWSSRCLN